MDERTICGVLDLYLNNFQLSTILTSETVSRVDVVGHPRAGTVIGGDLNVRVDGLRQWSYELASRKL